MPFFILDGISMVLEREFLMHKEKRINLLIYLYIFPIKCQYFIFYDYFLFMDVIVSWSTVARETRSRYGSCI